MCCVCAKAVVPVDMSKLSAGAVFAPPNDPSAEPPTVVSIAFHSLGERLVTYVTMIDSLSHHTSTLTH